MKNDNEENSECTEGFHYHDYEFVYQDSNGVVERCTRCNNEEFFGNRCPDTYYLSFHLRSLLQKNNPRYAKEFETNI